MIKLLSYYLPYIYMNDFTVFVNKTKLTKEPIEIEIQYTHTEPIVHIPKNGFFYTMIMVDPDAPPKQKGQYFIHWLIINNIETIVHYMGPNPPYYEIHHYQFYFFRQKNKINVPLIKERHSFDLEQFVENYKLEPIKMVSYTTHH
jgi:phosphatidylethanolamine-binding protein (PEBP) family uncharacterized protein